MEIKSEEIQPIYDALEQKADPDIIKYFEDNTKKLNHFIANYEKHFSRLQAVMDEQAGLVERVEARKTFKENVLKSLLAYQQDLQTGDFSTLFGDFIRKAENEINQLDENITGERNKVIPFRNMARYFLIHRLAENTLAQIRQAMQGKSKALVALWQFDEACDNAFQQLLSPKSDHESEAAPDIPIPDHPFKQLIHQNKELLQQINAETRNVIQQAYLSFDESFQKALTEKRSISSFQQRKLTRQQAAINSAYASETRRWKNTHFVLLDDWAVDIEITHLYYSVFDRYHLLKSNADTFISQKFDKSLSDIRSFITASGRRLEKPSSSSKKTSEMIIAEKEKVGKQLVDQILAQSAETFTNSFSEDFDVFHNKVLEMTGKVSNKRSFIRSNDFDRGIGDSEISYISPRELLKVEAVTHLLENINGVKSRIDRHLEKTRLTLLSLGTVCDFNLESALLFLEEPENSAKGAIAIALEGYERAINQLNQANELILNIQTGFFEDLRHAVNNFNNEIQKLKNTDNLFELNMKVARIRTLERSKQFRKESILYIRELFPNAINLGKTGLNYFTMFIRKFRIRAGFISEKTVVSFEFTEFMHEAQLTLKKLPFVYQRLYQLRPTQEERFFVNRDKELDLLGKAFNNWEKDRFITCAVIGEKGSGTTSLINYFLRNAGSDIPVIRHTLSEKVYTIEQYHKFVNALLGNTEITSNEGFIKFLNENSGRQIIILENLQHMFLKKVNGFEAMKMFFELMAQTSRKVLWVGVYTPVSWDYLDKTILVSNYFTDEIRLEKMSDEMIREIIYKRNRLSGYQIRFIPTEDILKSKTFQKLMEAERQSYLEKQFFSNLNQLANGNISLAQLYWLRSTATVDEHTISISIPGKFDYSFIKDLSGNSLFALQVLLLHDGLTMQDFASTMNQSESACRNLLIPMLEKGLLIRPRKKFNINPITYKPVTDYLKSRNFIH